MDAPNPAEKKAENTVEKGRLGEDLAAELLEKTGGYRIVERNFRAGKGEIDLIAWHREKCLVFLEVKMRGTNAFGRPEEFVGFKKEDILARTAAAFCRQIGWDGEVRFDVVAITMRNERDVRQIEHFVDAFFPGWR